MTLVSAQMGEELERSPSIVSMTTATSVNDIDDTLSDVTSPQGTPRAGSPYEYSRPSVDLPPSYSESQAVYQGPIHASDPNRGSIPHSNDITVYRTETPHHYYPPHQDSAINLNGYGVNDAFTTQDGTVSMAGDQPQASALLYHALAFTNVPTPPQGDEFVSHLTRPIAVPSIPNVASGTSPVQFARLYARILQTSSITASQFAAFVDGLNIVSTASSFSTAQLHASTPFQFDTETPHVHIPREQWVRAFIELSNSRFFAPRGLRVQITDLRGLSELAKVPELRGFRAEMCRVVLETASNGIDTSEEDLLQVARDTASKLDPYIEPLLRMIPATSQNTVTMQNIASGLAEFNISEKPSSSPSSQPLLSSPEVQQRQDLQSSSNPSITGTVRAALSLPITRLPPLFPPRLPAQNTGVPSGGGLGASWQHWGNDLGRRWSHWGNSYGRKWQKWGEEYGEAWKEYGAEVSRNAGSGSQQYQQEASGSSSGSAPQRTNSSQADPEQRHEHGEDVDWDETSSINSSSSSSSSSSSDSTQTMVSAPADIYTAKVAQIEEMASKARLAGKQDESTIVRNRNSALAKASHEKTKHLAKIQSRLRKRETRYRAKMFKRQMRSWSRTYKREVRDAKKRGAHDEVAEITTRQMAEMVAIEASWAQAQIEIATMDFETLANQRCSRGERKAQREARWAKHRRSSNHAARGRRRQRHSGTRTCHHGQPEQFQHPGHRTSHLPYNQEQHQHPGQYSQPEQFQHPGRGMSNHPYYHQQQQPYPGHHGGPPGLSRSHRGYPGFTSHGPTGPFGHPLFPHAGRGAWHGARGRGRGGWMPGQHGGYHGRPYGHMQHESQAHSSRDHAEEMMTGDDDMLWVVITSLDE